VAAKAAFLAKSGREKRNLERQKARLLSKEEMDRLQELENKKQVRRARAHACPCIVCICARIFVFAGLARGASK
jgi:inosine/xanthosine triphosphate pyrophosphatase family protein